jgi:hypothetical protein
MISVLMRTRRRISPLRALQSLLLRQLKKLRRLNLLPLSRKLPKKDRLRKRR